MIIQNATYSIIYPKANNIRREIFSLEDNLGDLFAKPFALTPIPDEAPEEIPRISATSHHGHSTLNISLNTTQLIVNYDENYWTDREKCLSYIKKNVGQVYKAISKSNIAKSGFLFSGLLLNILFDDLDRKDPIDIIMKNFCKFKSTIKPYDISNKLTFVDNDKYYINIACSNVRTYEGITNSGIGSMANMKQVSHVIGVNLDINDRYAFNYNSGYMSNENQIDEIFKLANSMLNDKIVKFVKEGVLEL